MELAGKLLISVALPVKLMIGIMFLQPMLKRREHFVPKAIASVTVIIGLSLACFEPLSNLSVSFLLEIVQVAFVMAAVFVCFKVSITQVSFFVGLSLALQQIAFNIITIVYVLIFMSQFDSQTEGFAVQLSGFILNFLHIAFAAFGYWIFEKFILKRLTVTSEIIIRNKAVIFIDFALTICVFIMFHFAYSLQVGYSLIFVYLYVFSTICCIFAVGYFISIFGKEKLNTEMETMQKILRENNVQHNIFKENIDIINRKCHDIKFMLSSLSNVGSEGYIDELKRAVDIYGSTPKTGSIVLDVILSENILRCKESGVDIHCIADGKLLDFIDEPDLYALFGNLISNALEAASVADGNDRYIDIFVGEIKENIIGISVENNYSGEIKLKNGLPQTTKSDTDNHGFGMKSIDYIVRKYNGGLDINCADGVFKLSIVLEKNGTAAAKM